MNDDDDSRIRLIEESRGAPLAEETRVAVLAAIGEMDRKWAEGRTFYVPDGTEPGFLFHPTPLPQPDTTLPQPDTTLPQPGLARSDAP